MQKKVAEQAAARALRREGKSLREIAWELGVSLASASVWVRDIPRGGLTPPPVAEPPAESANRESGERRVCGRCAKQVPLTAFNRSGDGYQGWCRECFKVYFRERGQHHRDQSERARRRRRAAAGAFVADYLAANPCEDCGEDDATVLEFDHVGAKRGGIAMLMGAGYSLDALRREIAQCEVVCVNCHRRRTAKRAGWRRAAVPWWRSEPPKRYETARNLAYAYSYLERSRCRDCGEDDLIILDFDHVGPKTGTVLQLASDGVGLERLEREIANCEVRCANCHRRRHANGWARVAAGIT